jgi:hypothetical protein
MSYKIRFHLAHGVHYQNWQVKIDRKVVYYDPEIVSLVMMNCKLKNHKTVAEQIYRGSHKTVCAWIECDILQIVSPQKESSVEIIYNPKIAPYWRKNDLNIDDHEFKLIYTSGKKVFVSDFEKNP